MNQHINRPKLRIAILTCSSILILLMGCIPIYIVRWMLQKMFIKVIIASAGVLWALFTVIFLCLHFDYIGSWKQLGKDRRQKKFHQAIEQSPEYMRLRSKYRHSFHRHESHYRHRKLSVDEMIEAALSIPEEEWKQREEFYHEAHDERHKQDVTTDEGRERMEKGVISRSKDR